MGQQPGAPSRPSADSAQLIEAGTNWATDASSGGAQEGRKPSVVSVGAGIFEASAGTAGTAGSGDGVTAGGGFSSDAICVGGAGLDGAADEWTMTCRPAKSPALTADPVEPAPLQERPARCRSRRDLRVEGAASAGGAAADGSVPPFRASPLYWAARAIAGQRLRDLLLLVGRRRGVRLIGYRRKIRRLSAVWRLCGLIGSRRLVIAAADPIRRVDPVRNGRTGARTDRQEITAPTRTRCFGRNEPGMSSAYLGKAQRERPSSPELLRTKIYRPLRRFQAELRSESRFLRQMPRTSPKNCPRLRLRRGRR